jgi:MFS family permease
LGLGSAFAYIGAVYVAMTWFPSNRVAMLTGLTAGVGFGGAIGGEFLLQAAFGTPPSWARGMWVLAIIGLVLTLAIWLAVPEQPAWHLQRIGRKTSPTFKSVMSGLFDVMRHGSTWLVSIGCSFMYLPLAFAGNWGPRDLHVVLGIDPAVAPRVYALFYVGIGLGCPLIGLWSDAVGRRKPFLVWGSVAAAVGTAAMALLPQATSDLVWFILPLWGLVVSTYVLGYPLAVELNRRDAGGTAIAFVNGIGMVVAGLMVWLFGVVIDALAAARGMSTPSEQDLRWGLAMLAGLILLAAVIHLLVREPASMTRGQPRQHP